MLCISTILAVGVHLSVALVYYIHMAKDTIKLFLDKVAPSV